MRRLFLNYLFLVQTCPDRAVVECSWWVAAVFFCGVNVQIICMAFPMILPGLDYGREQLVGHQLILNLFVYCKNFFLSQETYKNLRICYHSSTSLIRAGHSLSKFSCMVQIDRTGGLHSYPPCVNLALDLKEWREAKPCTLILLQTSMPMSIFIMSVVEACKYGIHKEPFLCRIIFKYLYIIFIYSVYCT